MVALKSIYVNGYRNIKDTTVRFENTDQPITLLLAPNNYGKTNFLRAIDFAARLVGMGSNEQEESIRKNGYLSRNKPDAIRSFTFAVELIHENKTIKYAFEITKHKGVLSEFLEVDGEKIFDRSNVKVTKAKDVFAYVDELRHLISVGGSVFGVQTHQLLVSMSLPDSETSLSQLKSFHHYTRLIRDVFSEIADNMFCDLNEIMDYYTFVLSNDIERDGIGESFIEFYEKEPKRFETFKNIFLSLFPNIENLRLENRYYGPSDQDKTRPPDAYRLEFDPQWKQTEFFSHLSSGTRGIFIVLLFVFLRKNIPLLAIEEIENGIHFSLYREVLNALADVCGETTKILATTHSPVFAKHFYKSGNEDAPALDYYSSFYVGCPHCKDDSGGYATFLPLKQSMWTTIYQETQKHTISIGELLFDMMTSSDDTIEALQEWLGHE